VLNLVKHANDFGISFENLKYDFGKAIDRSRDVVGRLTRGVGMLMKKNNVEHIQGSGSLLDANTVEITDSGRRLSAKNIIIASGARQRIIPTLPIDHDVVITSRDALELRRVPKRVVIVGGGATGCEFGHIYRTYGAEVTIVELLPRLIPNEDAEISAILERSFRRQGIQIITGASVQGIAVNDDQAKVSISIGDSSSVLDCDKVLVSVGVQGNVDNIGLENAGIETENSYIKIDDTMSTNVPGVYAIGDVTGKLLLAHVATAQGVTAVETIAGLNPPALDYSLMPRAIYCKPQVGSFGLTEEQAKEQGYTVKIGKFPMSASGKALALGETEGMIKLVVDAEIGEVLGGHMIGAEVTELLGELSMTRLLEGTTTELGWLVHPHPSISETIKEAALAAEGEAIHI
jgi:dihydrolipoamide dehydrogenase